MCHVKQLPPVGYAYEDSVIPIPPRPPLKSDIIKELRPDARHVPAETLEFREDFTGIPVRE